MLFRSMQHDLEGSSIESTVKKYPYDINRSLLNERTVFYENAGLSKARIYLHQQYLDLHPDQILTSLTGYLSENFVDDMLAKAARLYPSEFYNYASALQIGGSAQTINWANGSIPVPAANKKEIETILETLSAINRKDIKILEKSWSNNV